MDDGSFLFGVLNNLLKTQIIMSLVSFYFWIFRFKIKNIIPLDSTSVCQAVDVAVDVLFQEIMQE